MKNRTLKALFNYKMVVVVFLAIGFLIGYFVTEYFVNNNFSYYDIELKTNQHPTIFLTEDFFKETLNDIDEYNSSITENDTRKKISYASIDYGKMLKKIRVSEGEEYGVYTISIKRKFFPSITRTSNGTINYGIDRCSKYMNTVLTFNNTDDIEIEFLNDPIAKEVRYNNPYYMGLIAMGGMFVITLAFFFIIVRSKNTKILVDISDNELIFKTPFNRKYWSFAKSEFNTVKNLCGISVAFALMFICKIFVLPSGFGSLGIGLTYLVFSIIGMIYGPICGVTIGFLSDILGYFVFQSGTPFFFGYTFSAMLSGLVYGLCFYKTKITFAKCLYARLFVNLVVNVILGSLWWGIIYDLSPDAVWSYIMLISLPKNLVYLLPQSILLFIVLKAICRPISSFGLIDERIGQNISIL